MFGEEKHLKDSKENLNAVIKDMLPPISYTKTEKLITALYMVTDILEKDEPLRSKLRTLGAGIISDINSTPSNACSKISEIMSFLNISSTINIISEMNCSILQKEFLELDSSIRESYNKINEKAFTLNKRVNLTEFFREETPSPQHGLYPNSGHHIGHSPTRLGVQKGGTLLKALSDKNIKNISEDFDVLKKQRRYEIVLILKNFGGSATIKDIKDKAQTMSPPAESLISCSEKTLQRELISMIKDGVLNKVGEKRWSKYFLMKHG